MRLTQVRIFPLSNDRNKVYFTSHIVFSFLRILFVIRYARLFKYIGEAQRNHTTASSEHTNNSRGQHFSNKIKPNLRKIKPRITTGITNKKGAKLRLQIKLN